jgi:hypothetical protein
MVEEEARMSRAIEVSTKFSIVIREFDSATTVRHNLWRTAANVDVTYVTLRVPCALGRESRPSQAHRSSTEKD